MLRLVPTLENCSVYVEGTTKLKPEDLRISYRKTGTEPWLPGHALTASQPDPTPRGSLFYLKEDTSYDVRCIDTKETVLAEGTFTTWQENVPIARTVYLKEVNPRGEPYLISEGGSAAGWVRYVGAPGYEINGGDTDTEGVLIEDKAYVILENVVIKGGKRHGIQVKNSHHIRICNCDISGFGRVGVQDLKREGKYYMPGEAKAINWDAGIYLDLVSQMVIEHNYIHDPRGHANSWFYSHPAGPNALFVRAKEGGLVVRYNDFIGSEQHRWNDVVESYGNGKPDGGFHCDSDIYGNFLAFPNDDGIELDGGQCNVRFYGNKVEGGLCGISTAANLHGPSYIFNNLVVNLGDERGVASAGVKNGGGDTSSKGTTYFYNNIFFTRGNGNVGIGFGSDANRRMFLGVSRNNIYAVDGLGINDPNAPAPCSYDFDLFSNTQGGKGRYEISRPMETNAVYGSPGFIAPAQGNFALRDDSLAIGSGVAVPGLSPLSGKVSCGAMPVGEGHSQFPVRPAPLIADKYQLFLTTYTNESASDEQTLTLKAGALAGPAKFKLLKNSAADWLEISAQEGEIQPNGTFQFKVKMDARTRKPGLLLGAVVCKLDSGDSLPVTVYGMVASCRFSHIYEAEATAGHEQFIMEKDDTASGAGAVRLMDEEAKKAGTGNKALTLRVNMAEAGTYYLYFKARCPQPYELHDSLFLSVNGEAPLLCSIAGSDAWSWISRSGRQPYVELNKGPNEIRIIPREELLLDCVLLQSKPLFPGDSIPYSDERSR